MLHDALTINFALLACRLLLACGIMLLVAAALHDIAFRTIPNLVSLALAADGLALRAIDGGLGGAILAAAAVFAAGTVCWLLHWLGGGDVKLLAAATAIVRPALVFDLLFCVSLAGGLLAVVYVVLRAVVPAPSPGRPASFGRRIVRTEQWRILRRGPIPYASAITAGVLFTLVSG